EASDPQRRVLYRVLGGRRPTTPELVRTLLRHAFDRGMDAAREGLDAADRNAVAAAVAERLRAPAPPRRLRWYARDLRHELTDAALADAARAAVLVDPAALDDRARAELFDQLAQADGGFD